MADTSLQVHISATSELSILKYMVAANTLTTSQYSIRDNLTRIDRNYIREADYTTTAIRNKLANKLGDKKHIQNVTVPIIMPQVETALEYMSNVFLTGYPIFGVAADPATEDSAMMIETIIGENAVTAGWVRQLMMFFRDGLKYNIHGIECSWQRKNVYTVETDISKPTGTIPKTTLWEGNVLKRMDMYNTFFDPRVHPAEIHSEGEYAGYIEIFSRMRFRKYINDLYSKVDKDTIQRALKSTPGMGAITTSNAPYTYYRPIINPYPLMNNINVNGFDWASWFTDTGSQEDGISYGRAFQVMTLYARIMPSDFGIKVPDEKTPQVWKFVIINGQVVLYAERQTNAHNFIPILFGQPIEDGMDFQTKSFASNVEDMQDIASAMWNGYIAGQRRLVGDRTLYDPSRIRSADINSTNPAAKIPVRPGAYGKPISDAVHMFPYQGEPTESLINGATLVSKFADTINGQNAAQRGQFTKGNRTKTEFEDIAGNSDGRNQMMALCTENQVFTPMKEIIKLNILQYQGDTVLFNRDKQQSVTVNTTDLRKAAVHFKVSDGVIPEDKQMSEPVFQTAIQMMLNSPVFGAGFNVADAATYMFKQQGADLSPFQKSPLQVQWEQQLNQWQQVAMLAAKSGGQVPPQPTMPQALQQELQQKQASGGAAPSQLGTALEATQGVTQ